MQALPLDERMTYEASLVSGSGQSQPCVVTGYPVLGSRIEFARGRLANQEDWNKLVMAAKMVSDPNIQVRRPSPGPHHSPGRPAVRV